MVRASAPPDFLAGGGAAGALLREHDWAHSPLGAPEGWPVALKTAVALMLGARQPAFVAWGPELASLLNEGCLSLIGAVRPGIGLPLGALWHEAWADLRPAVAATLAGKAPAGAETAVAIGEGPGRPRRQVTIALTPLRDEDGAIRGLHGVALAEETVTWSAAERAGAEAALRRSEARLAAALAVARLGTFEWDMRDDTVEPDGRAREIFGLAGDAAVAAPEVFGRVDAAGLPRLRAEVAAVQKAPVRGGTDYRLRLPGSAARAIRSIGEALPGPDDEAGRAFGIRDDITEELRRADALRASEEFSRRVLEGSVDCIKVLGLDGRLEFMSTNGMCAMEVGDFAAIRGAYWPDFWRGDENAKALAAVDEARRGRTGRFQGFATTMKGSPRWWDVIVTPINGMDGRPEKLLSVSRDVSATKRAEELLRLSEARYRTLFEAIDEGFCVLRMIFDEAGRPVNFRYLETNPAFERQTGMGDVLGRTIRDLVPGIEPIWLEIYGKVALTGEPTRFEDHAVSMGRWFDVYAFRVGDPDLRQVAVLFNDTTARKAAEARLRELNASLEAQVAGRSAELDSVWRLSRDMLSIWTSDGVLRRANPAWTAVLGLRPEEVEGRRHDALLLPEDRDAGCAWLRQGGTAAGRELRYRHKDGSHRWIAWTATAPEGDCIYAVGRDVTAEKARQAELDAAEAARRDADALYRAYFENTAESLFVLGVEGDGGFRVEQTNPAHQASTGIRHEDAVGRRIEEILPRPLADQIVAHYRRALEQGGVHHYRDAFEVGGRMQNWDTVLVPIRDASGRVTRLIGSSRDLTRQVAAEEALRQAQKMEAIGQLTGGIAHDFNNLLGAVVGSLDLIRRKAADVERVRRYAEVGLQAATRGAKLTGQLLAFSRSQRIELQPLVVPELVAGMHELLARTLGPMIRLRFDLDGGAGPVLSDVTQLEMSVLNLAINARDAMADGGELRIATAQRRVAGDGELSPGEYIELSVSDTGCGMSPAVAVRAFDPFFTTKGVGKGTGLGLSQVYGIARQAGGAVRIESREGSGTTIRLLLPRTEALPRPIPAAEAPDGATAPSASILVVDDDPGVRGILAETLDSLGYRVVAAADGGAGLAALDAAMPDLMIVDFAMPGMNGAELARAARARRSDLPIVFVSGYADTEAIERVAGAEAVVIRKPFRVDDLQAVLAEVLTRGGAGYRAGKPAG